MSPKTTDRHRPTGDPQGVAEQLRLDVGLTSHPRLGGTTVQLLDVLISRLKWQMSLAPPRRARRPQTARQGRRPLAVRLRNTLMQPIQPSTRPRLAAGTPRD